MKDKGTVVSLEGDMVQVKVSCFRACKECSAQNFCRSSKDNEGILSVKKTLNPKIGDQVEIEIPETHYNKALITLFTVMLAAGLIFMAAGYFFAPRLNLAESLGGFFGFLLGVFVAGMTLFFRFKKWNTQNLYPRIIEPE